MSLTVKRHDDDDRVRRRPPTRRRTTGKTSRDACERIPAEDRRTASHGRKKTFTTVEIVRGTEVVVYSTRIRRTGLHNDRSTINETYRRPTLNVLQRVRRIWHRTCHNSETSRIVFTSRAVVADGRDGYGYEYYFIEIIINYSSPSSKNV